MKPSPRSSGFQSPDQDRFAQRIGELRASLSQTNPILLANRTEVLYQPLEDGRGEFLLPFWEHQVLLTYPDFKAYLLPERKPASSFNLAMLLYYFSTADGALLTGHWIAFSELPDGRFYAQAFQSYTGQELARAFQGDSAGFARAALGLGGQAQSLGDASFSFLPLPRVPLLVAFWQGDEDFPASFQVLFDASAPHYLPTDAFAILGSTITHRLIYAKTT